LPGSKAEFGLIGLIGLIGYLKTELKAHWKSGRIDSTGYF